MRTNRPKPLGTDKLAAAKLRSQGVIQTDIAHALGVTEPTIGRWIKQCEKEGYLENVLRFHDQYLSAGQRDQVDALVEATDLRDDLRDVAIGRNTTPLRRIRVYDTGSHGHGDDEWSARRVLFGHRVARDVLDLILTSRVCAVAWGHTVAGIIEGIAELTATFDKPKPAIEFFPVRGDPLGAIDARTSPSALCAQLGAIVNHAAAGHVRSLAGVPAVIPEVQARFEGEADAEVIKRYAGLSKAYDEIYGAGNRRSEIDCILTTIGAISQGKQRAREGFGVYTKDCLETWGVNNAWLSTHVLGDCAGVFVERPGLREEDRQDFERMSLKWLGISLEDFQRCARDAENKKRPGVIVAALGDVDRARVVFECCTRLGIVNELFVDYEMKRHLEMLLEANDKNL